MKQLKNFIELIKTLYTACKAFPVDGILAVLGFIGCIGGIISDHLGFAFISTVLGMYSVYTAFRLNSKVIKL